MEQFEGAVCVITGGASGIGLALAEGFAQKKMKVMLADIEANALAAAEKSLRERGADVASFRTDVSDPDALEALAAKTVERFGKANVIVNNAGVQRSAPTWKLSAKEWKWLLDVNLVGVVNGIRAFVPRMLEQGDECHVINTASFGGLVTAPLMSAYSATKYAVVAISEVLKLELTGTKIGVSVLCPGFVKTNLGAADRNMPGDLETEMSAEEIEERRQMGKGATALVDAGVSTDVVVTCVLDAMRARRLYILTHPEQIDMFKKRADYIIRAAGESQALLEKK
jgi:NAD(P)-dependent dehydrogenase (short-subunit alcohol dehydrogenase family)